MSDITRHRVVAASNGNGPVEVRCSCGPEWHTDYPHHIEQATRAQIAVELASNIYRGRSRDVELAPKWATRIAAGEVSP